jgi:hypothetical protein
LRKKDKATLGISEEENKVEEEQKEKPLEVK